MSRSTGRKPLFPTSVVGSLPRPDAVYELVMGRHDLAPAEYEARMDAAVREAIALQERVGLDVVTDGEWRRRSYIGVIAELAHGFRLGTDPADGRPITVVVDKLAAKRSDFVAREIAFVRSVTKRMVKATLPAPALLGERLWDPVQSRHAYPSRDDFVRDCVPILRHQLELVVAAGADIVQIDDPHLCLFVDERVRARYDDPDRAADFAVDVVNQMVAGVTGVTLAVHLCRRAGARVRGEAAHAGRYDAILAQLNRLDVQHVTMEFTDPASNDAAVFRKLRKDLEIGLGCVSVTPGVVDSPETIAARVRAALRFLDKERVTLNPDCGFAPGSGAKVSLAEVETKLANEVAAARLLRAELEG